MRVRGNVSGLRRSRDAQTFVFFALTFGTIFLLCGLAIDSGLLFLAKARLARSVDGAALAAVGNFNSGSTITGATAQTIRAHVAVIMRNFAVANYTDLGSPHTRYVSDNAISSLDPNNAAAITALEVQNPSSPKPGQITTYTYNFTDGTTDANGANRKYVQVVLTVGTGGQITSATCNARCPVGTYFIGAIAPFFRDLKVSASSVATRNPRLIMIVLDRSASMLDPGGGAYGLPQAVVQFLDFFDTSADYIGIVSFGSNARLEMPLTTNFLIAGTNLLFDAYQTNGTYGVPGFDPEASNGSGDFDANYSYSGVRRFKFGGSTAADDGIRLGMEQLMANAGFNDPDVVKYMVVFTDGAWNQSRTLLAAPPYTNWTLGPPTNAGTLVATNTALWSTNLNLDTNIVPVPTFSQLPYVTNAIYSPSQIGGDFQALTADHIHDTWQSTDGTNEPITGNPNGPFARLEGAPIPLTNFSILGTNGVKPIYARYIDVWLPPGSVDYEWHHNAVIGTHVSDLTNPTNHISISQASGDSNELVVPGYIVDGLFFDGLDLCWYDNSYLNINFTYPSYKLNNYQEYFMWPDDGAKVLTVADAQGYTTGTSCSSLERQLMFRNYPNLLTGYYVSRPDDPDGPAGDVDPYTGAIRHSYGLGPYYPGAGFYWPFDLVGVDYHNNYALTNADGSVPDPDPMNSVGLGSSGHNGGSRHLSYSINMQSAAAAPEWSGEWFYEGTVGTSINSSPGNTALSTLMSTKAQWQNGAPSWLLSDFDAGGETIMTNESAHNTNVIPTASVWRPASFSGTFLEQTNSGLTVDSIIATHNGAGGSKTGGYVIDGNGNVYTDSMAWSGRPTHYFDFSQSKWVVVGDNHNLDVQALPLGNWKAQEYAWHARAMGVTIYTVGYGYLVHPAQQVILAQIANATNTTAGNVQGGSGPGFFYTDTGGTAITFNPNQPIGQQFFATNSDGISNDFYQVGTAINAALTQ